MLSVLVCSVAERFGRTPVIEELFRQADGLPVEVLALTDNRRMTIGAKRNHLVNMASGDYLAFVDDDDQVATNYIERLLAAAQSGTDVLTFHMEYRHNGTKQWTVHHSLRYPLHGRPKSGIVENTPRHTSAVRRTLAQQISFTDTSYGEDADWAAKLQQAARTEHAIPAVLYIYDDVPKASIARQYAAQHGHQVAYDEWKAAQQRI